MGSWFIFIIIICTDCCALFRRYDSDASRRFEKPVIEHTERQVLCSLFFIDEPELSVRTFSLHACDIGLQRSAEHTNHHIYAYRTSTELANKMLCYCTKSATHSGPSPGPNRVWTLDPTWTRNRMHGARRFLCSSRASCHA